MAGNQTHRISYFAYQMWKGYSTRVLAQKQREEEMVFIGMEAPGGNKANPQEVCKKVGLMNWIDWLIILID